MKRVNEVMLDSLAQLDEWIRRALGRAAIDPNWQERETLLLQDAIERQRKPPKK